MVGSEISEQDPYYEDMKNAKKTFAWLSAVEEIYGRPSYCVCGEGIKKEIDAKGQQFYVCKVYKNDGFHVRVCAINALADEVDMLRHDARKKDERQWQLEEMVREMRKEIAELKGLVKGSGSGSGSF